MTWDYEPSRSAGDRRAATNLRVRNYRERQRRGIACATVHVTEVELNFLVAQGYLPNTCAHKAVEVNSALSNFIRDSARANI